MSNVKATDGKMTNYRWVICTMLFLATAATYMDRQVLSLTWKDFIAPELNWTDANYGTITGVFSIVYAISMLFVGKFIDKVGTKKGYLICFGTWVVGAALHAICSILTNGIVGGEWVLSFEAARENLATLKTVGNTALAISTVSVWLFIFMRCIVAMGESGNFPSAIKITAEYFPKKDRGFATGLFNAGAQIGALVAPFIIPVVASSFGWEMAFIVMSGCGLVWMILFYKVYDKPQKSKHVNAEELAYIEQDAVAENTQKTASTDDGPKIGLWKAFTFRQTWAVIFGRFLPDGVWWFFLFWAPAYIRDVYGYTSDSTMGKMLIFTLYLISMLSLYGSYLPTMFIEKKRMDPYKGRMKAMLIFAFFPLIGLFAQSAGSISCWYPIIIIGIIGAAHQSWSANVYSVVSDMFPKSAVATVTGIGGMAGGVGCLLFNQCSGLLFTYSKETNMSFLGFEGIDAGYMIVFIVASLAYMFSWIMMKIMVPKYKLVEV